MLSRLRNSDHNFLVSHTRTTVISCYRIDQFKMPDTELNSSKRKTSHEPDYRGEIGLRAEESNNLDNTNVFNHGGKDNQTLALKDFTFILYTNQFSLGSLSLPLALRTLGMVPGIIAISCIGCLTWHIACMLLQYYCRHPYVVNIVDMVRVLGGKRLGVDFGFMMLLQVVFFTASPVITISSALNAISDHATCTVVPMVAACLRRYVLPFPRSIKFVFYTGIPNVVSVVSVMMIANFATGVKGLAIIPLD